MTKTTQEILERIRELADLKRLEFGCEVKLDSYKICKRIGLVLSDDSIYKVTSHAQNGLGEVKLDTGSYAWIKEDEIKEIIGLPVHLEHLLLAMNKNKGNRKDKENYCIHEIGNICFMGYAGRFFQVKANYDLTLSVEQNLTENEELRKLLTELLF